MTDRLTPAHEAQVLRLLGKIFDEASRNLTGPAFGAVSVLRALSNHEAARREAEGADPMPGVLEVMRRGIAEMPDAPPKITPEMAEVARIMQNAPPPTAPNDRCETLLREAADYNGPNARLGGAADHIGRGHDLVRRMADAIEALRAERDARHSAMMTAREAANQILARAEAAESRADEAEKELAKQNNSWSENYDLLKAEAAKLREALGKTLYDLSDIATSPWAHGGASDAKSMAVAIDKARLTIRSALAGGNDG